MIVVVMAEKKNPNNFPDDKKQKFKQKQQIMKGEISMKLAL